MAERQTTAELVCLPPNLTGSTIELAYRGTSQDGTTTDFLETIELPGKLDHVAEMPRDQMLRLLSLAAALSYFKAFAPGKISVPAGLTSRERLLLDEMIKNGLGEFAYVNNLPKVFETEVVGPTVEDASTPRSDRHDPGRVLVAVGGGKDSIVSIESLKAAGFDVGLFAVNSYAPIEATAVVAGLPLQIARRRLDPELFRLNAAGAPNGHVPVTAVNSLVAVLSGMALGYDTVAFSNEASSSYGNVVWHGRTINHQWSKGIEFERLLRESLPYGSPNYVSLLRPLTELRIARRFASHRSYHQVFTSCNRAFRIQESDRTSWCADCPKCRFVFLCLAPFMPRVELLEIFAGRDMFADPKQFEGFRELFGAEGLQKPFECVGEPNECRVALALLREHGDWTGHPFLEATELAALAVTAADRAGVFAFREREHFLPPEFEAVARAI